MKKVYQIKVINNIYYVEYVDQHHRIVEHISPNLEQLTKWITKYFTKEIKKQ